MRTIPLLLTLAMTSTALAGRFEIAIALAIADARSEISIVTPPPAPKPKLWFYCSDSCSPCVKADHEIRNHKECWRFISTHYRWTVVKDRPNTLLPSWQIEGGNRYRGYRGPKQFLSWLKSQHFNKKEQRQ